MEDKNSVWKILEAVHWLQHPSRQVGESTAEESCDDKVGSYVAGNSEGQAGRSGRTLDGSGAAGWNVHVGMGRRARAEISIGSIN